MYTHSKYSHFRKRWYWFFLLIPVAIFGIGAIVMLLWNALLPAIFNIGTITYWQAFGLFILARILFGGFHGRSGHSFHHNRHMSHLREKWMNMTDEERQKYKEELKKCCSHDKEEC